MIEEYPYETTFDGRTDRQMWIDIYKGVSIILVIIGHLVIPQTLYNFIFSFHMYAFFFIAGVTFKVKKEQSLGSFVIENIKRLYIPYLFFAFAWDITNIVIESYLSKSLDWSIWEILKNIASVIIGKGIFESTASVGPSWFLLAFLVVRIVCWLLLKLSDNRIWVFGVVSIILFAVGYLVNGYDFLPFRLFSTLTAFLFMFIGYCCKKTYTIIKKTNLLLKLSGTIIAFSIALIMSMLADKPLVLASNILPSNPMITLVGGLAGCFGLLILAILIEDIPVLSKLLVYYGINSLIIMGVHSEIYFALRLILEVYIGVSEKYLAFIICLLILVLAIPICIILNNHCAILVGKRKVVEKP